MGFRGQRRPAGAEGLEVRPRLGSRVQRLLLELGLVLRELLDGRTEQPSSAPSLRVRLALALLGAQRVLEARELLVVQDVVLRVDAITPSAGCMPAI